MSVGIDASADHASTMSKLDLHCAAAGEAIATVTDTRSLHLAVYGRSNPFDPRGPTEPSKAEQSLSCALAASIAQQQRCRLYLSGIGAAQTSGKGKIMILSQADLVTM
jgi:hypothetical protein